MPFLAAGAGIGAIGSIVGGGKQAKAATQAAQMQSQAATHAADLQNYQYERTLQTEQPWIDAGSNALGQIQAGMPGFTQAFDPTQFGLSRTFDQNPTFQGQPNFQYDQSTFQNDPALQNALTFGQQAIERSAAAKGQTLDPSTMKALQSFGQDTAQQYYGQDYARAQDTFNQNYGRAQDEFNQNYNRASQTYQQNYGNAFTTFNSNQANAFNRLANIAGLGQVSANQTGAFGANAATNAGNALMSAGNAQSAGIIGQANAFNNALGGATANFAQLLGNSQFQGWAKNGSSSSSYGSKMTPYNPTYPVNSGGF